MEKGEYLRALAAAVGAPGGRALKQKPLRYLREWLDGSEPDRRRRGPAPLPSHAYIDGWHSRLMASKEPLNYLLGRGLAGRTIERYRLGYDGTDLILPVYTGGELVNLRRRRPVDGARPRGLRGRGAQLYPNVPHRGLLLMVAGEFDALVGRQHGVRTITTTCGARLPDYLVSLLAGRSVAVAYDVGEEAAARQTVRKLRSAASDAWVVRLGPLGLPDKGDLNDHYLRGGTTRDLLALVARERRARRAV
jgi:hypothetical protein